MNNRKVLFVDVDQTLYDNVNGIIYSSTIDALKKLSKRTDVDIFLATGRAINILDHLQEVLPYFKGFVTNNGQTVIVNSEIIYEHPLPTSVVKKLEQYANDRNIPIAYVGDYSSYMNFLTKSSLNALLKFHIYSINVLNKEPYNYKMPVKQFWFFGNRIEIDEAKQKVPELDFVYWPGEFGCDAMLKGVSKKDGIEAVLKYFKYQPYNTYAIGDGDNDIGMFSCVEHSIAMGNGTKLAKTYAKEITDSIEKDGFAKAIIKAFHLE